MNSSHSTNAGTIIPSPNSNATTSAAATATAVHSEPDGDDDEVVFAPADHSIRIHRWKVREGSQVTRNHIVLLYHLVGGADEPKLASASAADLKRLKVAHQTGIVRKCLYKDGDIVPKGAPLLELGACIHTTVIKDMCADCGADLRQEAQSTGGGGGNNGSSSGSGSTMSGSGGGGSSGGGGNGSKNEAASVPMIHSVPELKVTEKLAQKLGKADTRRLLADRKLVLLVDLDQTIIHTTNDDVPVDLADVYHFQLYGPRSPWYHTRLRPGTFRFLSHMATLYELHICTFGARNYAHQIAQILDADGKYFSHRILSRDECFNLTSKTDNLKALFPCGDAMVCIIDDREDVWNMASNLIQVKPYHYFTHTGDINAPPGLDKRELDGKGAKVPPKVTENGGKSSKAAASEAADVSGDGKTEVKETDPGALTVPTKDATSAGSERTEPDDTNASADAEQTQKKNRHAEDPDDYLLYLESVLTQIHTRFYHLYDANSSAPDLKQLVPKIRSEILRGQTLVFSGLVPNQQRLEVSKAYVIARSLGATVKQQLTEETTHLVAATAGTFKVNAARKRTEIRVVTPEWLWTCAERWERVEERLFPLDPLRPSRMRQPPPHCHSPEHAPNYSDYGNDADAIAKPKPSQGGAGSSSAHAAQSSEAGGSTSDKETGSDSPKFMDTINPLLSFTTDDLADMNQEFDQFFDDSSTSDDDDPTDMENPPSDKKLKRRRQREEEKVQRTKAPAMFRPASDELAELRKLAGSVSPSKKFCRASDRRLSADEVDEGASDTNDAANEEDENDAENVVSSGSEHEGVDYNDDDDDDEDDDDERKKKEDDFVPDNRSDSGSGVSRDGADGDGEDEEDDGDWNRMGAALEREFLGLD